MFIIVVAITSGHAVTSSGGALAYLCALRASRVSGALSPANSSNDGEEVLSNEELLYEASLDVQEAINSCSVLWRAPADDGRVRRYRGRLCGRRRGRYCGVAAALLSCKCDGSRGLLRDALDVVAQLGDSPGEGEQLLRLWAAGLGSAGQEQSATD